MVSCVSHEKAPVWKGESVWGVPAITSRRRSSPFREARLLARDLPAVQEGSDFGFRGQRLLSPPAGGAQGRSC